MESESWPPLPLPRQVEVARRMYAGFRRVPPITTILLTYILLLHGVTAVLEHASGHGGIVRAIFGERSLNVLIAAGARSGALVEKGELWRLVSCLFLHANALHLLLNLIALFGLGRLCEAVYGPVRFLFLFFISGISGSILSHLTGMETSVGASGAILGMMAACVVFGLRFRTWLAPPIREVFGRGLLPWIVLSLFIGLSSRVVPGLPLIDNPGHIGGIIAGSFLSSIMGSPIIPGAEGRDSHRLALTFLLAVLMGWTAASMVISLHQAWPS